MFLRQATRKLPPQRQVIFRRLSQKSQKSQKINISYKTALPCGGLAGSLGALCGVGGGLVIIPVLKQFSKMTIHQITATSLFSITIASSVGAVAYISQGEARVPEAGLIAASAMITAGLGARVGQKMPAASLTKLLALTMMLSVPAVIMKSPSSSAVIKDQAKKQHDTTEVISMKKRFLFYLGKSTPTTILDVPKWFQNNWGYSVLGLFVGFSSSLLGIGGGIIMTTYMSVASDLTQHEAVATSLVAMVPTGLSATFWHMRAGNVQTRAALMIGGSCAAAMYGAATHIAPHVSEPAMRKIFAVVLGMASIKMLF